MKKLLGERFQMDTTKVAPVLFQSIAIDDYACYQVVRLYPRRTASHTLAFIEYVANEMPFPNQRVQMDRGSELAAYVFQQMLDTLYIRWRLNKRGKLYLNGELEWIPRTDLQEFYSIVDLSLPVETLNVYLKDYAAYYNFERIHGSVDCETDKQTDGGVSNG